MAKQSRLKNRVWPLVGAFAIIGIWIVSAAANFDAGLALSNDASTSLVLGLASVCVDILKAVMLFIMAMAAFHRRWLVMTVGLVCFLLCGAWSMRSAAQFILTAFDTHEAKAEIARAVQDSQLSLLDLRTKRAGFLSQQVVTVQGNKSARTDALTANKGSAQEFSSLVKDIEHQQESLKTADVASSVDPVAEAFHIDPANLHKVYAGIFALILEMISGFGFWLMAMSRTPKDVAVRPDPKPAQDISPPIQVQAQDIRHVSRANVIPMPVRQRVLGPMANESVEKIKALVHEPMPSPHDESEEEDRASIKDVRSIVLRLFEEGDARRPEGQILYGTVGDVVNAHLPKDKQIGPHLYSRILFPAIASAYPGTFRIKRGGRSYLYGIRQKAQLREAERA